MSRRVHLCTCNQTMPLDAPALLAAVNASGDQPSLKRQMCGRELAGFSDDLAGDAVIACTQEQRLLGEVASDNTKVSTLRFVNIRETAGWSKEANLATPKIAALLAGAMLPDPDPTTQVSYASKGEALIIADDASGVEFAKLCKDALSVSVVIVGKASGALLSQPRDFAVVSGQGVSVKGWLGAFEASWQQANPIDLDACVRCGACVKACPEGAIGDDLQVNLDACKGHRSCVKVCDTAQAIDFSRADKARSAKFDLVINLTDTKLFTQHQPPQGYLAPGRDALARMKALAEAVSLVGEFEKPKFFNYRANLCAHGRNKKSGCTACIDVCSTQAIVSKGDKIEVVPQLCMGCGACATVCPSGALGYVYPKAADSGTKLKAMLAAYHRAGGKDALVLLHDATSDAAIAALAKTDGLPARVIPMSVHHAASTGLDLWLGALVYGASEVVVTVNADTAPQYRAALQKQMAVGNTLTEALGYQGEHFALLDAAELNSIWARKPALTVRDVAVFNLVNDKRTSLDVLFEHLAKHAPTPKELIALPAGSLYGAIAVNADKCTMCLACVGACPEGALQDNAESPQLRFIERKCVQCGLCEKTCPEAAISLVPQLDLRESARKPRVLNEAQMANCITCQKPLGTAKMIENMLSKLTGHSMFADEAALKRLRMCADCRVADLYTNEKAIDVRRT